MNKTTKSYLIYAPASMTLQSLVERERETKQNKTQKKRKNLKQEKNATSLAAMFIQKKKNRIQTHVQIHEYKCVYEYVC